MSFTIALGTQNRIWRCYLQNLSFQFWLWYGYLLYLEIYIPHAQICRKLNTNVPHIHNIASQTMLKVYFETFQSFQLTNIVIIASQKVLAKFGFGRRFHDRKYIYKLDIILFLVFLEFIINLRHRYKKQIEEKWLSYFKQSLDNYVLNVPTCTQLAPSSKIGRLGFIIFININCLALLINVFLKCLWFFLRHDSKLLYSFKSLSLKHVQGDKVVYLTCACTLFQIKTFKLYIRESHDNLLHNTSKGHG